MYMERNARRELRSESEAKRTYREKTTTTTTTTQDIKTE